MKQKFAIGGSGSSYIYGLMDSLYRENMTREECKEFCKKCISHAMARDGSSGGVIRLVIIDKDGVEKEVILGKTSEQQNSEEFFRIMCLYYSISVFQDV
jgi:20S proteasome subunit beta 1